MFFIFLRRYFSKKSGNIYFANTYCANILSFSVNIILPEVLEFMYNFHQEFISRYWFSFRSSRNGYRGVMETKMKFDQKLQKLSIGTDFGLLLIRSESKEKNSLFIEKNSLFIKNVCSSKRLFLQTSVSSVMKSYVPCFLTLKGSYGLSSSNRCIFTFASYRRLPIFACQSV